MITELDQPQQTEEATEHSVRAFETAFIHSLHSFENKNFIAKTFKLYFFSKTHPEYALRQHLLFQSFQFLFV